VYCPGADAGVDASTEAGVDASTDTGEGGVGGAGDGAGGDASGEDRIPIPDAGMLPEGGAIPPVYNCPPANELPQCVTPYPGGLVTYIGWNGTACCYTFSHGCY
jgi:hypothetical protein